MSEADVDPSRQILVRLEARGVHVDHALQGPPGEVHRPRVSACERLGVGLFARAHHERLLHDADRHVAPDHETESAEHLLLDRVLAVCEDLSNPRREPLVVGHRRPPPCRRSTGEEPVDAMERTPRAES